MKLKNKTRLLKELAKESNTPIEFIEYIMALQQQNAHDLAEASGISIQHYYVIRSQLRNGQSIGTSLCVKLAKGLDINPAILNWVVAEYNLKLYMKKYGINPNS